MAELVPAKQRLVNLRGLLSKQQGEIAKAIPKGIDAQRFVRAALTVFARTPKLLDCDTNSVLGAVMQAAQLGLELDPGMGQAYLVPYGRTCTMITGYQGLVTLAMRTPDVKSVIARAVYAKDYFAYELGLNEKLEHKPTAEPDKGDLTFVYAVAKLVDRDGMVPIFEVMSKAEVDKIRSRSRAKDSGPWVTDYEMMARKTVVRRLAKWLPKATDFARAIAAEDRFEMGKPGDGVDEMIDELLAEPPIEGQVVGDGAQQPAQEQPAKPEPTSLDKLADQIEQKSEPEKKSAPPVPAAQEPSGTTKPAEAAKPKVEYDPRPDSPPSPTARDLSRQEQASRHEVPRAHKQADQTKQPAKPANTTAAAPPAKADSEMTADEIDWGQSKQREPGEEG